MSALPAPLERAVYGFMASHALFAAEGSGLLAALCRGGRRSAGELAAECSLHAPTVDRLLTALVSMDLVERSGPGYHMPDRIRPFLDRADPMYSGGLFPLFERVSTRTFARLGEALKDGEPQLAAALGEERASPFDVLYGDDVARDRFAAAMWSLGYRAAGELAPHLALPDRPNHLVDVGGGSGSFAVAALLRWPHLTAEVFDLPALESAVASAVRAHRLEGRLSFRPGDFFRDALPAADLCSLGYILSDWSDEQSLAILRAAHRALRPDGRVLILERLFDDDRNGPMSTALMDLCMLLEPGGKHRTAREYGALLERAGFAPLGVHRSTGEKHLIVGRKRPDGGGGSDATP